MDDKDLERFWSRVKKQDNGCWEWQGALRNGYGAFKYKGKTQSAHRVIYKHLFSLEDASLYVCHTCDNRKCVNPDHLFSGTHSDNMKDAYQKGRIVLPNEEEVQFQNGHKPVNRRLSDDEARQIRDLCEDGLSHSKISELHHIPVHIVKDISAGRSYKNA